MIVYLDEGLAPFELGLLCRVRGSVLGKGMLAAFAPAVLAAVLVTIRDRLVVEGMFEDFDTLNPSQLWAALGGTLAFLISFRSGKAYGRFWEGFHFY